MYIKTVQITIYKDIVFDKAEQASQKEDEQRTLTEEIKETEEAIKSAHESIKKQLILKLDLAKEKLTLLDKSNKNDGA